MESYIQISKLNDFIFCPKSMYFHSIFESFNTGTYHSHYQTNGRQKHETIEEGRYSTRKNILQGKEVFSEKYKLAGKIDIYDGSKKQLIERKARVKHVFDGYKYQLYAQYFCMQEMGYEVEQLIIHSLEDNKRYKIPLPQGEELNKFESLIREIQNYDVLTYAEWFAPESKCANCIYRNLCH